MILLLPHISPRACFVPRWCLLRCFLSGTQLLPFSSQRHKTWPHISNIFKDLWVTTISQEVKICSKELKDSFSLRGSEGARLNEKNLLMESKSSTFFLNLWTRCLMMIFVITLKICRYLESGNTHGSACLNFVFHNSWIREGLEMKLWRLEVDDKPKGAGDMKPFHREVHKEGCRYYQWPRANVIEWEHSVAEGMLNSFVNHLYLIHNSRTWSFHRRISPVK